MVENRVAGRALGWNKRAMRTALFAALLLGACASAPRPANAQCLPAAEFSRAALDALKADEWRVADDAQRNALARALTACLGDADSSLRDGIVYEALQNWLRTDALSDETKLWLNDDLQRRLEAPEGDGFERPFAALVLSEAARADRVQPYLSAEQRAQLLDAATRYVAGVRDYRGFSEREGWRHGVAHGADLLLQLSLNPAFERAELARIRDAAAAQVAPSEHAYVFGEPERLTAPIIYIARRGVFSEAEWTEWLAGVASPAPFDSWDNTFSFEAQLRKRHNVRAFLMALYVNARLSENTADDVLLPGIVAALRSVP